MPMTTADFFADAMAAIWDTRAEDVYDKWSDPCDVAYVMGGKPVAHRPGGANNSATRDYLFPDGSIATVILNADGTGCGVTSPNSEALP